MACRVIVDLTFKERWCEKIRAMLEDEKNGLNLTANVILSAVMPFWKK